MAKKPDPKRIMMGRKDYHVHDVSWNIPHPFEFCCIQAFARKVCKCGFSEGNKAVHRD